MSYAGKNVYGAGKTSGVLMGGASGANRCYVLAHCGGEVTKKSGRIIIIRGGGPGKKCSQKEGSSKRR